MKKKLLLILYLLLFNGQAQALCLGYSWLTEMHAKRLSVNCKTADKQISDLVKTISDALQSGRNLDITGLGELRLEQSGRSSGKNNRLIRIQFKAAKELAEKINKG